ncbi:NAD(P)H-dependent oxidoreductase [Algicella marina]|uniref:Flavodoxin family protein n=1 Tax=Algicella marina TaxID=2683284 RepID=A0A6P1SYN1_9RHOB|nr:NAD(P)H-dependent oxidoreductase [Algicella marina]QHQ34473.1 flavodoxin family protein [Algicella marina]
MKRRIFIWDANPKPGSLNAALADAYAAGAEREGAEVRQMALADMRFDADYEGFGRPQPMLEPDLVTWQAMITWADHVVIVHPYWWGAMPARAKAVLDRALSSGFGYKYHGRGMGWDKLLSGRTGDGIITSDTPPWIDTLIYRAPARRVLRNQVLGFCGIRTRRVVQFGSVKLSDAPTRAKWLAKAERMGAAAAQGPVAERGEEMRRAA